VGEPGTDAEIAEFCSATYDVTFPVTTKIEVNGPDADPLWVHLRRAAPGRLGPGAGVLYQHLRASRPEVIGTDEVKWNFTKFLVDADGAVVRRYEPHETPEQIAADLAPDLATGGQAGRPERCAEPVRRAGPPAGRPGQPGSSSLRVRPAG
jgi:glutathione peroxidase